MVRTKTKEWTVHTLIIKVVPTKKRLTNRKKEYKGAII